MLVKQWKIKPGPDKDYQNNFSDLPDIIIQLLHHRGIKNLAEADEFFNPDYYQLHDPFLFKDIEKAVERILVALKNREKIMIHGDYDADGVTSSAIVYNTLRLLNANVEVFIPHRENDGYGLNKKNIEKFVQDKVKLLITVDCGVTNIEEIKTANHGGMDVIITDHHETPPELPPALAIINPKVEGETYPFKELSGVGMAYKLMSALLKRYKGDLSQLEEIGGVDGYLKWLLDLVAIGLVADVVPLIGENRTLVKYGLLVLSKTQRIGLKKLAEFGSINMNQPNSYMIGYQIAPRINAAGRLSHAQEAFELLTTEDLNEATRLAFELNQFNAQRKQITDQAVALARQQVEEQKNNQILFVYDEAWLSGVIGLIAGKICEETYKPTMAMTKVSEQILGSGRSLEYFNITESLYVNENLLARFGGHHQACGFTIAKYQDLDDFKTNLLDFAKEKIQDVDVTPVLEVDAQITLEQVTLDLAKKLEKFQPFGQANPKPYFWLNNLQITAMDVIGETKKHLRIMVKHPAKPSVKKLLGFNLADTWGQILQIGDIIEVIVELGVNIWQGMESVEMKIIDLRQNNFEQ
jgi:single-stranded-DNA-specific exonuclease